MASSYESGSETTRAHDVAPVRVLLVDDQHLIREALATLVTTVFGYEVIQAASGAEACATVERHPPDVVLLDVRMPEMDGITTLRRIKRAAPNVAVVMLSAFADAWEIREALDAGANGFIIKSATPAQLHEAVATAVAHDGVYVHPHAQEQLLWSRRDGRVAPKLSARERMVLARACEGATNEEIGRAMSISRKTVKAHMSQIFRKLDVANRTEAVALAIREHLVGDGAPIGAGRSAAAAPATEGGPSWSQWPRATQRSADGSGTADADSTREATGVRQRGG
jgi:DNA-binding NarL/FixJ family response regulator